MNYITSPAVYAPKLAFSQEQVFLASKQRDPDVRKKKSLFSHWLFFNEFNNNNKKKNLAGYIILPKHKVCSGNFSDIKGFSLEAMDFNVV
jgi:hypothetical protein